jgi:starvation-inducible outer membrane lipoprotein
MQTLFLTNICQTFCLRLSACIIIEKKIEKKI